MRNLRREYLLRLPLAIILTAFILAAILFSPYQTVYGYPDRLVLTHQEFATYLQENTDFFTNETMPTATSNPLRSKRVKEITAKLKGIPFKRVKVNVVDEQKVYVGGEAVGFAIYTDGVIIIGTTFVHTQQGKITPADSADIKSGDILKEINGKKITSVNDINSVLNHGETAGQELELTIRRGNKTHKTKILPQKDKETNTYKLGMWIRDNIAGIGTLTYVKQADKKYGALGHPICDAETAVQVPVNEGRLYKCTLVGITKGQKGKPGELRGLFLKTNPVLGNIKINNKFGVFGDAVTYPDNGIFDEPLPVANRATVKTGKAQILTTLEEKPQLFDIEITKASYQKTKDHKSMTVKVTDKKLLEKTGGIVQGMSGSPIIQDGRVIGALTHVFVNDPTRGYGIYLDWMYNEY